LSDPFGENAHAIGLAEDRSKMKVSKTPDYQHQDAPDVNPRKVPVTQLQRRAHVTASGPPN
jgi:hypothetical protein